MHMGRFKPGIGLLTKELDIMVVPVKLQGLYELKRRKQYFAPPGLVRVVFGEPIKFDPQTAPTEIAEELERRVARLKQNPESRIQESEEKKDRLRP
jgi:long-chain acyl-CoA synthetase